MEQEQERGGPPVEAEQVTGASARWWWRKCASARATQSLDVGFCLQHAERIKSRC